MTLTNRLMAVCVGLYAIIAVVTFGHAAANARQNEFVSEQAMTGIVGGMFWPLYWSWEAFENPALLAAVEAGEMGE